MIAIISPAKTLDFGQLDDKGHTLPRFPKQTRALVDVLRGKGTDDLRGLMAVSEDIASLNVARYQAFKARHNTKNAKPCLFAFKGEVYQGLDATGLGQADIGFAQDRLRILSGLYGLLRPLDLIQPYRLEMGTKLAFDDYKTLYDYWGTQIAQMINRDLKAQGSDVLVNLASVEYFKAVKKDALKAQVVDVVFEDFKDGAYKVIAFFAKRARGLMSRYIIQNRATHPDMLRDFQLGGYAYAPEASAEGRLVFRRG